MAESDEGLVLRLLIMLPPLTTCMWSNVQGLNCHKYLHLRLTVLLTTSSFTLLHHVFFCRLAASACIQDIKQLQELWGHNLTDDQVAPPPIVPITSGGGLSEADVKAAAAFRAFLDSNKPTAVCAVCSCSVAAADVEHWPFLHLPHLELLRADKPPTPAQPRSAHTTITYQGIKYCLQECAVCEPRSNMWDSRAGDAVLSEGAGAALRAHHKQAKNISFEEAAQRCVQDLLVTYLHLFVHHFA